MAATVAFIDKDGNAGTTLSAADVVTGWTGPGANTDYPFIQGTASLGLKVSAATTAFTYNNGATIDITDQFIYVWVNCIATLDSHVNGGIRIRVATATATDYGEWYVAGNAGNSIYPGGWVCYSVKCNLTENPFNATGGTAPTALTAIQHFGPVFKVTQTIMGSQATSFVDAIRVGAGLRVSVASHATPGLFADIITADEGTVGNRYGVVRDVNGVMMTQGNLVFGNTTGTHFFRDTNKAIVFEKHPKPSASGSPSTTDFFGDGHYKISVVGDTQLRLGTRVGKGTSALASQPVSINTANTRYKLDFTATATDIIELYGLRATKADTVEVGSTTNDLTGSITMAAGPTIAFNNTNPDTITRVSGSFVTDGFLDGMTITVSGATDAANNAIFVVDTVVALTITLVIAETLTARTGETGVSIVGNKIELVSCTFSDTKRVIRNVTASPLELDNTVSFNTDTAASLNIVDKRSTSSSSWKIIQNPGFIHSPAGTDAFTIKNHNFNQATKPYLSIADEAETWNVVNPSWTIGANQDELAFAGNINGIVNEQFEVAWTVTQPDGSAIASARAKIVESAPTVIIANQDNTSASGTVTSTYLRALYVPSGAATITTTTHTPVAYKVYKYSKLPFVSSATITAAVTNNITLVPDTFQVEASESNARTFGDTTHVVSIEQQTNSATLLKYTVGTGTLSVGNTVANSSNAATGVVAQIIEGNSTAGTVILETRNATAWPTGAHTVNNGGGGWTATFTSGSIRSFKWLIDADTLTMQELYDYLNAKLAESPIDTASPSFIDTVITWGRAEHAIPVQGDGSKFKTVRNVVLTQGWAVFNTVIGGVSLYTDDTGATFSPQATVTLTVNGVNEGAQCYIVATAGGPESVGTVLLNTTANGSGVATASYIYTSNQPVTARSRNIGYLPFETTGTITSSGLTTTAVWQIDPNVLVQVTGVNITFTNPTTITRASGDFGLDGWDVPGFVTVTGSTSNNGKFALAAVGTTTLTISGATLTNEGPVAGVTLLWSRT